METTVAGWGDLGFGEKDILAQEDGDHRTDEEQR